MMEFEWLSSCPAAALLAAVLDNMNAADREELLVVDGPGGEARRADPGDTALADPHNTAAPADPGKAAAAECFWKYF